MDKIQPTLKKEEYVLEDKDYLYIIALRELTEAVDDLRRVLKNK